MIIPSLQKLAHACRHLCISGAKIDFGPLCASPYARNTERNFIGVIKYLLGPFPSYVNLTFGPWMVNGL